MAKFALTNPPGTRAGEAERMFHATIWCHDKHKYGLGGYYLTKADMDRLRRILGPDTEPALRGAGFEPDPRPRHAGWWTGSRSPAGDECKIRMRLKWSLFRAIAAVHGETRAA